MAESWIDRRRIREQLSAWDALCLDDFSRLGVIGSGASASVYRAASDVWPETFALKVWYQPLNENERRRFHHECALHRSLSDHPNIVRFLHGRAEPGSVAWVATELCEESLYDRLRRDPPPDLEQARTWAQDLLCGLAEIHRQGHVHRDVKPSNVLLRRGRAMLCDLGIARPLGQDTSNSAAGTPGYLAPELVSGHQPNYRSDVYSAAVTLVALYAPFESDLPEGMEDMLTRASSQWPADRPPDAAAFLRQFSVLASRQRAAPSPVTDRRVADPSSPTVRLETPDAPTLIHRGGLRSRAALSIVVALVALLVSGLLWNSFQKAGSGPSRATTGTGASQPARTTDVSGCLDRVNAPGEVTTTHFAMSVQILCPLPVGYQVFLVAMIRGTRPAPVEYWINDTWHIDPTTNKVQTFNSTVSKGVTRTYFLIAATPAHLLAVKNQPGNLQPDGSGYQSLGDLHPVSNQVVNKQIPG